MPQSTSPGDKLSALLGESLKLDILGRLSKPQKRTAAQQLGLVSAADTAKHVGIELAKDDQSWTWRMLLQGRDHLRLMLRDHPEAIAGSWDQAPPGTGSTKWDTLLASLARHEFTAAGVKAPQWTRTKALPQRWVIKHRLLSKDAVIATTPQWLREANIYVPERDLITA